jgi:hypothetical protein
MVSGVPAVAASERAMNALLVSKPLGSPAAICLIVESRAKVGKVTVKLVVKLYEDCVE